MANSLTLEVTRAEAAALGCVLVPAERLAYLEGVERAARAELLADRRQEQHEHDQVTDIDVWNRRDQELYRVRRTAYEALHAALAQQVGEGPPDA